MALAQGGEAITPSETHIDEFIDWVHAQDVFQVPDFPTDLFALNEREQGIRARPGPAYCDR